MTRSERKFRRAVALAVSGLTALGLILLMGACSSLAKSDLEERLLALPKNAPARAVGLERLPIAVEVDGETEELELVYLEAPAQFVDEAGGERGAPVVLVHGTPSTLFSWTEIVFGVADAFEGLHEQRDVLAIEIAGHGVAPGDLSPYTFQRCADVVVAAVRALDLEPAHLVGSSYGGEFVWRAALDAPELFASVTLIDSSGFPRADGDWLPEEVEMRENGLAGFGWLINSRERIEMALAPHFAEIPPDRVEEFFLVCENAHNWNAMVDLARDENGERAGELGQLELPTLVLWGADDLAYPLDRYGARFAREIPGSRLVALPETGHYPHEERPREVIEILERHFAEVEALR